MKLISVAIASLMLVASVVLGTGSHAASASGNITKAGTLQFETNAQLVYSGPTVTGVDVSLHYSCFPPTSGLLKIEVDQTGYGGAFNPLTTAPATCDDSNQQTTVFVPGAFVPNPAVATGTVQNADQSSIGESQQEIKIK
jgi:hypothetical protein